MDLGAPRWLALASASPVACAEIVDLLLEAGAKKVYVADLMGIDQTIVPGGWALEDPFGSSSSLNRNALLPPGT